MPQVVLAGISLQALGVCGGVGAACGGGVGEAWTTGAFSGVALVMIAGAALF